MAEVKRDFGSFHSSNVQELLELSDADYVPPDIPFMWKDLEKDGENTPPFGHAIKEKHFYLEDDYVFLNHGAFGGVLKQALEVAQHYQVWAEKQPLRFYDRELLPRLVHIIRRLAKFVGCDRRDLVLLENATTGLNTVINSIPMGPEDVVFCFSTTYGAVKKMLKHKCERTGAVLQEVLVQFPINSSQQLVWYVERELKPGTCLAVFDHIPSNTPFIMPLKEIIDICKERNVPVLIDGAHALGTLPLNLEELRPDYYVANAHKWLCSPKGVAFMYVCKELQPQTRPLIISHGLGSGFSSEFIWAGLHDYSPFLALHTVLDFWNSVGPDKIYKYMYTLSKTVGQMLTEAWNTSLAAPPDMFGSMCLVELPNKVYNGYEPVDYSAAEKVQNILYHQYNIEAPIKCVQEKLFIRLSFHIYNELHEYEVLRDAMLKIRVTKDL